MIEAEYVESLLKENDRERLVCFVRLELSEVAKAVCAFLNSKGGRVLIGVDKNRKVYPLPDLEQTLHELRLFLHKEIVPESLIGLREEVFNDHQVILIEVIEGNRRPYSYRNQSFVRLDGQSIQADENEMSKLIRTQRVDEYSWEKSLALEASIEDLDLDEVAETIRLSNRLERSGRFSPDNQLHFLQSLQLLKNLQITNAAIVLFGKEPTYFLPQCRVRIVEFPDGKTGDRYDNTVLIEKNIFRAFRDIQDYFRKNIPRLSFFDEVEWRREDRMQFPSRALDEAVINAMMHRDYSDPTGEVLIAIYRERIEIINSGELPSGLKDKNLKENHRSIPPNPGITHVVFLAGMIEKLGRGTLLITKTFRDIGLVPPTWVSSNGATTLTMDSRPIENVLNSRTSHFLDAFNSKEEFTREQYQQFFLEKISERTARNDISVLLDGRWIEKIGDGAFTRYIKKRRS